MDTLIKYYDKTFYNSHDQHQKLGKQLSNVSYIVTFVSFSSGEKAVYQDNQGNNIPLKPGMVVSEGGLIRTNDQRLEIKSTSGITFRLGKMSEFSVERTIAGVVPVYYGKVYVFGTAVNNFVDGGKYRTSCYLSTKSMIDLVIMNISSTVDAYYSLNSETIIEEYDESGRSFPLFVSGEFNVTQLEKDASKFMKERYKVIEQREMTDTEINDIYKYFVNPVNWRLAN